jgi:hypothetical protein
MSEDTKTIKHPFPNYHYSPNSMSKLIAMQEPTATFTAATALSSLYPLPTQSLLMSTGKLSTEGLSKPFEKQFMHLTSSRQCKSNTTGQTASLKQSIGKHTDKLSKANLIGAPILSSFVMIFYLLGALSVGTAKDYRLIALCVLLPTRTLHTSSVAPSFPRKVVIRFYC